MIRCKEIMWAVGRLSIPMAEHCYKQFDLETRRRLADLSYWSTTNLLGDGTMTGLQAELMA